jgi:hypothetical protein
MVTGAADQLPNVADPQPRAEPASSRLNARKRIGLRACGWAGSRSAVWAPQGGDGQMQVPRTQPFPGVENVALAPSSVHQRPRTGRAIEGEPP